MTRAYGRELREIETEGEWFGVQVIPHREKPDDPETWVFVDRTTDEPILSYRPEIQEVVFDSGETARRVAVPDLIGLVVRVRDGWLAVPTHGPVKRRTAVRAGIGW